MGISSAKWKDFELKNEINEIKPTRTYERTRILSRSPASLQRVTGKYSLTCPSCSTDEGGQIHIISLVGKCFASYAAPEECTVCQSQLCYQVDLSDSVFRDFVVLTLKCPTVFGSHVVQASIESSQLNKLFGNELFDISVFESHATQAPIAKRAQRKRSRTDDICVVASSEKPCDVKLSVLSIKDATMTAPPIDLAAILPASRWSPCSDTLRYKTGAIQSTSAAMLINLLGLSYEIHFLSMDEDSNQLLLSLQEPLNLPPGISQLHTMICCNDVYETWYQMSTIFCRRLIRTDWHSVERLMDTICHHPHDAVVLDLSLVPPTKLVSVLLMVCCKEVSRVLERCKSTVWVLTTSFSNNIRILNFFAFVCIWDCDVNFVVDKDDDFDQLSSTHVKSVDSSRPTQISEVCQPLLGVLFEELTFMKTVASLLALRRNGFSGGENTFYKMTLDDILLALQVLGDYNHQFNRVLNPHSPFHPLSQ